ncbi:MAG: hypothetical protein ABW168_04935 [Sedimenticola sp.]
MNKVVSEDEWSDWLALAENEQTISVLRRNIKKGFPFGDKRFIEALER